MSPAERARKWYRDNLDRAKQSRSDWAARNPEKIREIKVRWVRNNLEKRRKAAREYNHRNRELLSKLAMQRYYSSPAARVLSVQRVRLRRALRGTLKAGNTVQLLGCSSEQLRKHLESQFRPGMNWENYGIVWEVDHIKPCTTFDFSDPEQQKDCFHFSNLQPLTLEENRQKGASYLLGR